MARVTAKGQITIPAEVRKAVDIGAGDEVLFDIAPEGVRMRVRKRARLSDLYGSLPATRAYPGKERVREETGRALENATLLSRARAHAVRSSLRSAMRSASPSRRTSEVFNVTSASVWPHAVTNPTSSPSGS